LNWADECKIDPQMVAALYMEHADALRRFVVGVLGDAESAADVLHATFAKLVELGHTVREDAHKSWLFSVAYREALALRRRRCVEADAAHRIWKQRIAAEDSSQRENKNSGEERMVRWETVQRVRAAIEQLPAEQREIVRFRMGEQKKFADIARDLQLPLGTVLSRMQLALAKLRKSLEDERP
jgi:RNA polymerase sigma-70 factor (ECF subfamily)